MHVERLHQRLLALCTLLILAQASIVQAAAAPVELVRDGQAVGAVIVPAQADPHTLQLADYFVRIVERSTGATLPVISEVDQAAVNVQASRLYLGNTRRASEEGIAPTDLPAEGYRRVVREGEVILIGRDTLTANPVDAQGQWTRWRRDVDSWPTRWAVNQILEEQLGVRWLWPGELGTHVPRHAGLAIPAINVDYQPKLLTRTMANGSSGALAAGEGIIAREAYEWGANHQYASLDHQRTGRPNLEFNHAFNKWFDRHGKTNPDWFMPIPPGMTPPRHGYRMKLRFANPAVIDAIVAEYTKAGAPDYWCVSENDGSGFDTSPEIRAWDIPQDLPIEDIWFGRANLTPRYVKIWNTIYDRLKAINPDVTLVTMAYSAYRTPPPAERPLTARMVVVMVVAYGGDAYDQWNGWRGASANNQMILRPNWGWTGGGSPHLPLRDIHQYMTFASQNGMIGFRLDSIVGFWGTQAPMYYMIARLMNKPELTYDQILEEFTSAFGKGAPAIRQYIAHFEKITDEAGFDISGHYPDGKLKALREQHRLSSSGIVGHRQALQYIYPDEVLAPAYRLLDDAIQAIGPDDAQALARVQFLRDGLDEFRLARDRITLYEQIKASKKPDPKQARQYRKLVHDLQALRTRISPSHAIWGQRVELMERRYNYPNLPQDMNLPPAEDDGW